MSGAGGANDGRSTRGILIGIAGGSASGKTLVARRLLDSLATTRVVVVKQDSYYRDLSGMTEDERARQNFDHPDSFDTPLLQAHLRTLLEGGFVDEPIYDFSHHRRAPETTRIGGAFVIVLEGILILSEPALRDLMDIKIFVDTEADVRLSRLRRRDAERHSRLDR